ncbi:SDR family NAD(P)-dependent oxidoreductase [Gordonia sp. 'Campus']|uniref:SDR family NAD(P)-dependent oxidoreductase n=1 Tax=Gordonia sp. 'Campus' TaxID=2915824 RepID=UPI001EE46363|nr:SDR family oxidoreductase [Gordonia sp. 'Campus']
MTDKRVDGKIAVVIGGGSGIGEAAARTLAAHGAAVTVADVKLEAAEAVAADLGGSAQARWVDVADEESVAALFTGVTDDLGGVDIAVNCAGLNIPGFIVDLDAQQWQTTIELCLTGSFLVTKHAGRTLNDGGSLIGIASLNARQPAAGFAGYCAAKAGMVMLAEVAALELAPRGIRVNSISPGLVDTPLVHTLTSIPIIQEDFTENTPLGRNGRPDEIAEAVLYLASDDSRWVTGETININGGAHLRRYPDVMRHLADLAAVE